MNKSFKLAKKECVKQDIFITKITFNTFKTGAAF